MATELVTGGCDLTDWETSDLRQRYPFDQLPPELAAHLKAISEGTHRRRRGRLQLRAPAIEFPRRYGAVADYHLFLREEQQRDAARSSRTTRRSGPSADETPRERALMRVKKKYGFVASPRRIENLLCEWWKDGAVRRCALRQIRRAIMGADVSRISAMSP